MERTGGDEAVTIKVDRVVIGSPAAKAGIVVGDQITAVDGEEMTDARLLPRPCCVRKTRSPFRSFATARRRRWSCRWTACRCSWEFRGARTTPSRARVFVTRVVPYSPAARAGIKLYDRIYALTANRLPTATLCLKACAAVGGIGRVHAA